MRSSLVVAFASLLVALAAGHAQNGSPVTTGQGKSVFGSWRDDAPGKRWHITPADLPQPFATRSVGNSVRVVGKPANAQLRVPAGFEVALFASGLQNPRL